jgi:hypothetical protein
VEIIVHSLFHSHHDLPVNLGLEMFNPSTFFEKEKQLSSQSIIWVSERHPFSSPSRSENHLEQESKWSHYHLPVLHLHAQRTINRLGSACAAHTQHVDEECPRHGWVTA